MKDRFRLDSLARSALQLRFLHQNGETLSEITRLLGMFLCGRQFDFNPSELTHVLRTQSGDIRPVACPVPLRKGTPCPSPEETLPPRRRGKTIDESKDDIEKRQKKLTEGDFTLDDFRKQFEQVKNIGMRDMISRMPGMDGMLPEGEDPEAAMARITSMIDSMTKEERQDPDLIGLSQRQRIAADSGTSPQEVEQFLRQFEQVRALMRQLAKMSLFDRIKRMTDLGISSGSAPDGLSRDRFRPNQSDNSSDDGEFMN
jgi:hypothetical protein